FDYPGFSLRLNPGLKLANAFGVIPTDSDRGGFLCGSLRISAISGFNGLFQRRVRRDTQRAAEKRLYSERSATSGSTWEALRAGKKQANTAMTANTIGTITKIARSRVPTPKRRLLTARVSAYAPATPNTIPIAVSIIPFEMISLRISVFDAPSAMRIPISRVRCVTLYDSTP